MQHIKEKMIPTVLSIIITVVAVGTIAVAAPWADPSATPPGNNAPEPINVSGLGQAKGGGLIVNTAGANIGLIVQRGKVAIGTVSPNDNLLLDVEGRIGATEYCDNNGNNCKQITATGGDLNGFTCVGSSASLDSGTSPAWTAYSGGNSNYPHCGQICTPAGWETLAPCGSYY